MSDTNDKKEINNIINDIKKDLKSIEEERQNLSEKYQIKLDPLNQFDKLISTSDNMVQVLSELEQKLKSSHDEMSHDLNKKLSTLFTYIKEQISKIEEKTNTIKEEYKSLSADNNKALTEQSEIFKEQFEKLSLENNQQLKNLEHKIEREANIMSQVEKENISYRTAFEDIKAFEVSILQLDDLKDVIFTIQNIEKRLNTDIKAHFEKQNELLSSFLKTQEQSSNNKAESDDKSYNTAQSNLNIDKSLNLLSDLIYKQETYLKDTESHKDDIKALCQSSDKKQDEIKALILDLKSELENLSSKISSPKTDLNSDLESHKIDDGKENTTHKNSANNIDNKDASSNLQDKANNTEIKNEESKENEESTDKDSVKDLESESKDLNDYIQESLKILRNFDKNLLDKESFDKSIKTLEDLSIKVNRFESKVDTINDKFDKLTAILNQSIEFNKGNQDKRDLESIKEYMSIFSNKLLYKVDEQDRKNKKLMHFIYFIAIALSCTTLFSIASLFAFFFTLYE